MVVPAWALVSVCQWGRGPRGVLQGQGSALGGMGHLPTLTEHHPSSHLDCKVPPPFAFLFKNLYMTEIPR